MTRTTFGPRVRERIAALPVLAAVIEPLPAACAALRKSFAELYRQVLALDAGRSGVPPAHAGARGRGGHGARLLQRGGRS